MRMALPIVWSLLLLSWLSGCARREPSSDTRTNVVLVVIDALRADHLGCYGYERETSPAIDHLAASGFVFDAAISAGSTTAISMASLFTSLHPVENGMRLGTVYGWRNTGKSGSPDPGPVRVQVLNEDLTTLAEVFASKGYRTMGVMTNPFLQESLGFNQGFRSYEGGDLEAGEVVDRFLRWIEDNHDSAFFSFLHFIDVHQPYKPGPPYDTMFRSGNGGLSPEASQAILERSIETGDSPADALQEMIRAGDSELFKEYVDGLIGSYDGAIRKVDDSLERLVQGLESAGLLGNTMIVITADHGEGFIDHGNIGHGVFLYDELIRVPLILVLPEGAGSGRRVADMVSLIDLMPTLLEIADVPAPEDTSGRSFASLIDPGSATTWEGRPAFSEQCWPNACRESIRTDRYKLIRFRRFEPFKASVSNPESGATALDAFFRERPLKEVKIELYDLTADPDESVDMTPDHPDIVADLVSRLDVHLESLSPRVRGDETLKEVTPETEKRLRALGYLK